MAKGGINITGLDKVIKNLEAYTANKRKQIMQVLDMSALNIETNAKLNLQNSRAVDEGLLRDTVVRQAIGEMVRSVGTKTEYAPFVELGRSPGSHPPVGPLKGWAKRHGLPESAAYGIAKNIEKYGQPARPFLFPALEAERENFLKNLKAVLNTP